MWSPRQPLENRGAAPQPLLYLNLDCLGEDNPSGHPQEKRHHGRSTAVVVFCAHVRVLGNPWKTEGKGQNRSQ
jgi:hypothetical protein